MNGMSVINSGNSLLDAGGRSEPNSTPARTSVFRM